MQGKETSLVRKYIDIDDDPTEDILCHLNEACEWIDKALEGKEAEDDGGERRDVGVLVHCVQGISRSGSIVVAYCESISHEKFRVLGSLVSQ